MTSGAEYSTDYDFFTEHQLAVVKYRTGTKFVGRLDGTVFLKSDKRTMQGQVARQLSKLVHIALCKLRYGGEIVD
jgi:hypothetical protein